jgi:P-type E1-E2 ATPase
VRSFADGGKNITGMCGDGGNDCAALRAATFGFALSETDAGAWFRA